MRWERRVVESSRWARRGRDEKRKARSQSSRIRVLCSRISKGLMRDELGCSISMRSSGRKRISVNKAAPQISRTQVRSPRVGTGNEGRPSGLVAGAVPVERQRQRERARCHIPKNVRVAIRGSTGLPQGSTEERLSPSETSLLEPCAVEASRGSRDQPQEEGASSAGAVSKARGILGLVADSANAEAETAQGVNGKRPSRPAWAVPPEGAAPPRKAWRSQALRVNLLRKRCSNAHLAKRRSLGWVAALPPASPGPGASRLEASRARSSVTNPLTNMYMYLLSNPLPLCNMFINMFANGFGNGFANGFANGSTNGFIVI